MTSKDLTGREKSSLSELARKLIDRQSIARSATEEFRAPEPTKDSFSVEGLLTRVAALEAKSDASRRAMTKSLNTVLFTVERLEMHVARLEGELTSLLDASGMSERLNKEHRDEMSASATKFGEAIEANVKSVLDRVEALVDRNVRGKARLGEL